MNAVSAARGNRPETTEESAFAIGEWGRPVEFEGTDVTVNPRKG